MKTYSEPFNQFIKIFKIYKTEYFFELIKELPLYFRELYQTIDPINQLHVLNISGGFNNLTEEQSIAIKELSEKLVDAHFGLMQGTDLNYLKDKVSHLLKDLNRVSDLVSEHGTLNSGEIDIVENIQNNFVKKTEGAFDNFKDAKNYLRVTSRFYTTPYETINRLRTN